MTDNAITASHRVAEAIRTAIDDGTLLPGEHIRQEHGADRLGVSRVPIPEALKALSSEGLIAHDTNRGYFAQRMDPAEIRQIYRLRQLIEPEILGALEPFTADEIAELRRLSTETVAAFRARDIPGGFERERNLYATIWAHCPHKVMIRARREPNEFADFIEARHRELIQALADHDLEIVQRLVIEDRQTMLDWTATP